MVGTGQVGLETGVSEFRVQDWQKTSRSKT